jgi:hypothetical protein
VTKTKPGQLSGLQALLIVPILLVLGGLIFGVSALTSSSSGGSQTAAPAITTHQRPADNAPQKPAAKQPAPVNPNPGAQGFVPDTVGCLRVVNGKRLTATLTVKYTAPGQPPASAVSNPPGAFAYKAANGSFEWAAHGLDPSHLYASVKLHGSMWPKNYRLTATSGGPKSDVAGKITEFKVCGIPAS